ncbi:MAG: OsmC family peroxiredoxin [Ornithinimicrobium sp.]|uniref:OsmC family peroxiredoxin n=1 Tax=Ornithinimicrobium sp. TaxID=1977084 RepID=UPI0026E0BE54|nr:OsmC family peroxiredoxin [Ornithinimicrobium sp.]MDO5740068.1 OsmC family peroxiredoxin [Ornithinimicrobium sp.]
MKIIRRAGANWAGPVPTGSGFMRLGRDGQEIPFTLKSRTEDGMGTNPEEMLGAAHAGCFSMSLCDLLEGNGTPGSVQTESKVTMEEAGGSFSISRIDLVVTGDVAGIDADTFSQLATKAKETCPVSRLFAAAEITLKAQLG